MRWLALVLLAPVAVTAQLVSGGLVNAGDYNHAAVIRIAPGQVLPLFLRTTEELQPASIPDGRPWPAELSGVGAHVEDWIVGPVPAHKALAIGEVRKLWTGSRDRPHTYVIQAQIPFDIVSRIGTANPEFSLLRISLFGLLVDTQVVEVASDAIHVQNACDSGWVVTRLPYAMCRAIVRREDGSEVSARRPATPGETVTIHLYGLGQTVPATATGRPFQPGADLRSRERFSRVPLRVWWDFTQNSTSARLTEDSPLLVPAEIVAGPEPVAGSVGRYRVDIRIPESKLPACGAGTLSNATLMLVGIDGRTAAPICIAPAE